MQYNHSDIAYKVLTLRNHWLRARQESASTNPVASDHDYVARLHTYLHKELGESWLALVAAWLNVTPDTASLLLSVVDLPKRYPTWDTHCVGGALPDLVTNFDKNWMWPGVQRGDTARSGVTPEQP
jgi:hypothetical protein